MLTDDEIKFNIATNVRRLLESRGWSQKQLADASGETQMIISRICRGLHIPHAGTVVRLAEAFDVSVDRLVMTAPEKIKQPA